MILPRRCKYQLEPDKLEDVFFKKQADSKQNQIFQEPYKKAQ